MNSPRLPAALLALLFATAATAVPITGTVRFDANRDGWASPDEPCLQGMLVSDGYGFAVTDAQGHYTLETHEKAQTLYVQRTDKYTADVTRFWHRLTPGRKQYDFLLEEARPVPGDALTMVVIGDSETHGADAATSNLDFMEEVRRYIGNHPEVDLFVNAGDISAQNPVGMEIQRDAVNAATMGRPVVYACGNHDVDFRGKGFYGQNDPFMAIYGPWWESFELGGYLFVIIPIYNSWGAPILYDMLDCGDWLKALCQRYPDKKKIMIAHDLPDLTGYRMATHTGDVVLDDEKFVCTIYAHKHMNIVKKYPSGRKAFCVAAPNKGGAGCFAPSFRIVRLDRATDQAESDLFLTSVKEHLALVTPNGNLRPQAPDGSVQITADAYDGGDEIATVTAQFNGSAIALEQAGAAAWRGQAAWKLDGDSKITLTATTKSGRTFSRDFDLKPDSANRLAWLTQLPADVAMCDLQLVDGLLIVGVCDDANAENGGLYALNPATGEIVWSYLTGYGIRNNFAVENDRLFAIDTRANIHAVEAKTGRRLWLNASDPAIVSPAASGVVCHDGIVAGGYGRHLRGLRADDGTLLWRNTGWQTEERTPAEDKLAVEDGALYVISRLNGLYRHDLKTGQVVWQYKTLFANASPLVDGNSVWLISGYGSLLQIDKANGKLMREVKSYRCFATTAAPVKLPNGLLLIASGAHGLGAFDPATGQDRWRFTPKAAITPTADYATGHPTAVTATPLFENERLWVAGNDGILYLVSHRDGHAKAAFIVGMPILNRPCAGEKRLYVSDCRGRVMAIDK